MKTLKESLLISTIPVLMFFHAFSQAPAIADSADHSKMDHSKMGHKEAKGKELTLTGKLIGLTCFLKHGGDGNMHKSCAVECAEKGLPIALFSDGVIYQISGDGHESLVEAYKPLLKYMESSVKVKGTVFEKDGVRLLVIKKIKKS